MPNPDSTDSRSPGIGGTAAVEPGAYQKSLADILIAAGFYRKAFCVTAQNLSGFVYNVNSGLFQRCAYTSDKHFYDLVLAFNYKFMIDRGSVKLNAVFAAML